MHGILNWFLLTLGVCFVFALGILWIALVFICPAPPEERGRIWRVLVLPAAAAGLGSLLGFVYSAVGSEEKKFGPVFAAINGLIGGAALTDLTRDNGVIVSFFGSSD